MRGNPIKEWIIFSALWLVLLIPVIKLTLPRKAAAQPRETQQRTAVIHKVKATARLRYTGKPHTIKISQSGRMLCETAAPAAGAVEHELMIAVEDSCAELFLQAQWPDQAQHAFEMELIVEGEAERKVNFWAERELEEVASFRWR